MKRVFIATLLMLMLAIGSAVPAMAYSYGDPNEEELATMFKQAMAKIESGDWPGVLELYKVKRAEIESHFGSGIAVTLDRNIEAKDRGLTEQNLKALLVLNLERRFEYGEQDINDYSKSKLLLAKAKATYDALEPYVQAKLPNETTKLRTAFDAALDALGNPGLFGVGKKPVQPEEYKKQTAFVLDTVRPLFPYKEAQAQTASTPAAEPAKAEPAPAASQPVTSAPAINSPAKPEQSAATATLAPSAKPEAQPAVTSAPEASPTAAAAEPATPAASPTPDAAAATAAAAQTAPAPEQSKQASPPAASDAKASGHAPMEREDKTNTGVTFAVIGFVAAAAGGTVWWARKKGIL